MQFDFYEKPIHQGSHHMSKPEVLVSIIIPTKDQYELLNNCIKSITEKSTYQNYEIIVINNQSKDEETLNLFQKLQKEKNISIIDYNRRFNYSAINNFAVRHAKGDNLLFLNNMDSTHKCNKDCILK
jgi:O-antigen biosynthesis protein